MEKNISILNFVQFHKNFLTLSTYTFQTFSYLERRRLYLLTEPSQSAKITI